MDEQRLFATGTNPTASPENDGRDAAMQAEIDSGQRKFGEPPRCTLTGHLCGSDTVAKGHSCPDSRNGNQCPKISFLPQPKAAPGGWRDIESAPKVYQPVLVAFDKGKHGDIHRAPAIAAWHERGSYWGHWDSGLMLSPQPIAWQPLPATLASPPPEDKGWFKQCFDAAADAADALMAEDKGGEPDDNPLLDEDWASPTDMGAQ